MRENSGRKYVDPILALSGSSLEVYLLLLSVRKPLSIRDIQRALGFKSPNSVRHHLEKLSSLGLIRRAGMGYMAVKPGRSLINAIVFVKGHILPRRLFTWLATILLSIFYFIITPITSGISFYAGLAVIGTIDALASYDLLETYIYLKPLLERGK